MIIKQQVVLSNSKELEIIDKQYDFVYTPKPQEKIGFKLEEWIEETDTAIINHWDYIPLQEVI